MRYEIESCPNKRFLGGGAAEPADPPDPVDGLAILCRRCISGGPAIAVGGGVRSLAAAASAGKASSIASCSALRPSAAAILIKFSVGKSGGRISGVARSSLSITGA